MYFEIFKKGKLIKRGTETLDSPSWDNELMYVPSMKVTLPAYYNEYISGREEFRLFINDKCFWGIITGITLNKDDETLELNVDHAITEWTYRQISVNNAVKDKNINIIFKGSEIDRYGDITISANPFNIFLEEIGSFTPEQFIQRAGAVAWKSSGAKLEISVNASALENRAGSYDVSFSSGNASVTVKATVKESKEEKTQDGYTLSASSFSITTDDVGGLSSADYINRANATVTPSATITVDHSAVVATAGMYDVVFSISYVSGGETRQLSVTVSAIVTGEGSEPSVADDIADILSDTNFAYPGWTLNFSAKAEATTIDYVYSRQNKLDALTKTMELTPDLFWRVGFSRNKVVDISEFGKKKPYTISLKPTGKTNIHIITEPEVEYDFENVVNLATVYSEKSDSGMSSMTLREVYMNPSLQINGFPIVILRNNVNNERNYKMYTTQYPKLAPNNQLEYAILDEESIAMEAGELIEGTYAFNDLSPFTVDDNDGTTKQVTDADRKKAAQTAYHAAIKKLKSSRRRVKFRLEVEQLPVDLQVGDRVRFLYDNRLYMIEACTSYIKEIMSVDDWFYITSISYNFNEDESETNEIVLEKYLHIDRETDNQ